MSFEILSLMSVTDLMTHFGEKVKTRRKYLRLSRSELAKKSGVSKSTIERLETKGIGTLKVLIKLAITLDSLETFETLFDTPKIEKLEKFLDEK